MSDKVKNRRRLVIDLGNTLLKMGVYDYDRLLHNENQVADQQVALIWKRWKEIWQPGRICISSTVKLSHDAESWIMENNALRVSADLRYPFDIQYKTPETLGQDRLAAVSAAYSLYKGKNVLTIDCGTCITYDFLTSEGHYIGGNIAPGIRMRLRSMHDFTDCLPLVDLPQEVKWIGQSTSEALQSGGLAMAVLESRGLIFYLKENYGNLATILTGGDAGYFINHLGDDCYIHRDLVLFGLNEILKNNEI